MIKEETVALVGDATGYLFVENKNAIKPELVLTPGEVNGINQIFIVEETLDLSILLGLKIISGKVQAAATLYGENLENLQTRQPIDTELWEEIKKICKSIEGLSYFDWDFNYDSMHSAADYMTMIGLSNVAPERQQKIANILADNISFNELITLQNSNVLGFFQANYLLEADGIPFLGSKKDGISGASTFSLDSAQKMHLRIRNLWLERVFKTAQKIAEENFKKWYEENKRSCSVLLQNTVGYDGGKPNNFDKPDFFVSFVDAQPYIKLSITIRFPFSTS